MGSNWIWTNAAIVRMLCHDNRIEYARTIGDSLARKQLECGGWIVRDDYDKNGAIPVVAPNDSAFIANNAFIELYNATGELQYLNVAIKCADWIMETCRSDSLVYTGFNMRENKWEKDWVIVDTGFTAALFANLVMLTGEDKYRVYLSKFIRRYIDLFFVQNKRGFCTSIDRFNHHHGGMFARGQAWALEGMIPAYKALGEEFIKETIEDTVSFLLKSQATNGSWPYNLSRRLMGEDCKGTPVIAKNLMDWYEVVKRQELLICSQKALSWCENHTAEKGEMTGGIFSFTIEGAIEKSKYTMCAFVYASSYAIELKKQIENEKFRVNKR